MKVALRVKVDIEFETNGESVDVMRERLVQMLRKADGEGMFTGDGPSEVEDWHQEVEVIK